MIEPIAFDRDQWEWLSRLNYEDYHLRPFKIDKLVIHWGGNTDPDGADDVATEAEEAAILRGWQRYHMDGRGWVDIAYSFGFGNSGLCYRLRGFNRNGATSGDYDEDGILEGYEALALVWIGGTAGEPTEAMFARMGQFIRDIFSQFGELEVTVHSDHKPTACPGDTIRAWVNARGWENDVAVPPAPKPEGAHEMETIRNGDGYNSKGTAHKRPAVKAAQIMAAHRGYYDQRTEDGTCGADGIFGSGTEAAIKDFQQDAGLVIDGIVGPSTWDALENGDTYA